MLPLLPESRHSAVLFYIHFQAAAQVVSVAGADFHRLVEKSEVIRSSFEKLKKIREDRGVKMPHNPDDEPFTS